MPEVKFTYFTTKALCEGIRMLLADGGHNFEDIRVTQEEWPKVKPKALLNYYEQDPKLIANMQEDLVKNYYSIVLPKLDQIIRENNGYLAVERLTWADFIFAGMCDAFRLMLQMPDLGEKYPGFKKLRDAVVSLPRVKEYCDYAPKRVFSCR